MVFITKIIVQRNTFWNYGQEKLSPSCYRSLSIGICIPFDTNEEVIPAFFSAKENRGASNSRLKNKKKGNRKVEMNRKKGGLYGLLIGDALGVPYEFCGAEYLPPMEQLEFVPPKGFPKSYPEVPCGTWSDDGAQALCLLESLLDRGMFELTDFADKLLDWYENGRWAVDQIVFDVGIQTGNALNAYKNGVDADQSGNIRPDGKGNGALMRVLPLALWHQGEDAELIEDAHMQCMVTHGHPCNQVCCALYCLTARRLMEGFPFTQARQNAVAYLRKIYHTMPPHEQELEWTIRPDEPLTGRGSGYVVDCLKSAFLAVENSNSYETAVKNAVAFGNDTDTTACVAGGLAGILYGYEAIPNRFIEHLREKEKVENLYQRLETSFIKKKGVIK